MAGAAKLALVPLVAVAVILAASGIHGRRTHDPARARRALDILAPTDDAQIAKRRIDEFFESGWVGWDVKTAIEVTCGTIRGRQVSNPVLCLDTTRRILEDHEQNERRTFTKYTWLAWSSVLPGGLALVLAFLTAAPLLKRRK